MSQNRRMLLAEDTEADTELFLERFGDMIAIDVARDLSEAVEFLDSFDYDLCVLDVMLGLDNGYEILAYITEHQIPVDPIIIASDVVTIPAISYENVVYTSKNNLTECIEKILTPRVDISV